MDGWKSGASRIRFRTFPRSVSKDRWRPLTPYIVILLLALVACTTSQELEPDNATPTSSLPDGEPTEERDPATRLPQSKYDDLEIVTLLPRDAIPAIDAPQFLTIAEADRFYDPDELVIGVEFNSVARAYSVPFLSNHEIVNDNVGGVKIAVTW
jgi:hypothetical protein